MASLMFSIASSRVSPSLTQPGSAGQVTVYPSRLFPSSTIGSFTVRSSSCLPFSTEHHHYTRLQQGNMHSGYISDLFDDRLFSPGEWTAVGLYFFSLGFSSTAWYSNRAWAYCRLSL